MPGAGELRLGTRGSKLALWQANAVAGSLAAAGGPSCRLVVIRTSGDHLQDVQVAEGGGKRIFVKELEEALVRGEIDLAVHSSKDLPAALAPGLAIAAALPREDPRDAVVVRLADRTTVRLKPDTTYLEVRQRADTTYPSVDDLVAALGPAPRLGTGSVRRAAQLARLIPHARFAPVRGNLDTRLRKLDEGQYDALVLAAAGLRRLGLAARISLTLPATSCIPAPGQGIVAVEIRADDERTRQSVVLIDDRPAQAALTAERAVVAGLGGGCQTPVGALATPADGEQLEVVAVVVALDGSRLVGATARGPLAEAASVGSRVANELLDRGAAEILANARRSG